MLVLSATFGLAVGGCVGAFPAETWAKSCSGLRGSFHLG